jgi:exosortase/archaeosortase family protein
MIGLAELKNQASGSVVLIRNLMGRVKALAGLALAYVRKVKPDTAYRLTALLLIAVYLATAYPHFSPIPEITAKVTAGAISLLGYNVTNYKNILIIDFFNPVKISSECSGVILALAFILTIQLVPHIPIPARLTSLLLIPFVFFGNILRIILAVIIGLKVSAQAMILYHDSLSQVLIFFWAISIYIVWLKLHRLFPKDRFNAQLGKLMQ